MAENGNGNGWLKKFTLQDLIRLGPYILALATLIALFKDVPGDVKTIKREGATRRQVNALVGQVNRNYMVSEHRFETLEKRLKIVTKQTLRPVVVYRQQEPDDTEVEQEPQWEWEK